MLIANEMQKVIEKAVAEAKQVNIAGKSVTPFLLDRVRESTSGESLASSKCRCFHLHNYYFILLYNKYKFHSLVWLLARLNFFLLNFITYSHVKIRTSFLKCFFRKNKTIIMRNSV